MIGGWVRSAPRTDVVWFLGVSTRASVIHQAVSRWAVLLGRPWWCHGVDLPVDATPGDYVAFCD